jgi:superfamily II DNA or RNA helicase
MSTPASDLRFTREWRPYQARVLEAADAHLADDRLHLVAAPGAGKTSLGLELFRRLGRPALVLAPTRTIRDQWIERLADFRAPGSERPDWVSADLDRPAFLTVVTYQALHTRSRRTDANDEAGRAPSASELSDVAQALDAIGVGVVILDEAHHLRQAWWRALARLLGKLAPRDPVRLVSLTATPPYDVTGREWSRYEELCGPIDEEISVPELVLAGTLAPHQDFVLPTPPSADESRELQEHDAAAEAVCAALLDDEVFRGAVAGHPWVEDGAPDPEKVLERPELAVALLLYLRGARRRLPQGLLELLDARAADLPLLDRGWWQELVGAYLSDRAWKLGDEAREHRKELRKRLRRDGLLWRSELRLDRSRRTKLALSRAKVDACVRISERERSLRGEGLRQVILTDYVRDEGFDEEGAEGDLGAWPVFRALARPDAALLTGRLTVVHAGHVARLRELAGELQETSLGTLEGFVRVSASDTGPLVRGLTDLLSEGRVRVLVGTRALLGEGWDAPGINSLVLASVVGSFISTNQMRGRAIRVDPVQDKVASIWHLVALEPGVRAGREDLEELERRFMTFVGLSHDGSSIESGLRRLALPKLEGADSMRACEEAMFARLDELGDVASGWRAAVEHASEGRVQPTVVSAPRRAFRRYHLRRTLAYFVRQTVWIFLYVFTQGARSAEGVATVDFALQALIAAAITGFVLALPGFVRALILCLRHLPVDGSVKQIALALRDALAAGELLETPKRRLKVRSSMLASGAVTVALHGATFRDQSLFADALAELLGPVANPRYLLTRRGRFLRRRRVDYNAVPRVLGTNKELATALHRAWKRRVGPARLIYTRNTDGRRELLEARLRAFSTARSPRAERSDRWH